MFTKKDMILSGLTTVDTEGNLLESGGMFYIDPTINGQRLTLKEGQYIDVEIPADEIKEGMQLYKISRSKWRLLKSGNIATDYKNKKYKVKINKGFGFGWFNCDRYFRSRDYKLRDYKLIVKKKNNKPSFFIHTNTIPAGHTNPKLHGVYLPLGFVEATHLVLTTVHVYESGLSLFFNDKNSSMNGTTIKNKKIEFGNLSAGDHITLVGIGYLLKSKNEKEHFNSSLEDQIPFYAIKEHEIKKNIFHRNKIKNLEFKQMTSEELDQALASL
ncbi:MAG: hypothetical protein FVQ77_14985 [Cytophagales bacterium]|nr:hypothetical protein [Cytophagales bacterium]